MRGRHLVAATLWMVATAAPILAEPVKADGLPGYYEFFMKAGKLTRIEPEKLRDEQMAAGQLEPVRLVKPMPDVSLPLPSGESLPLKRYEGKRNLVLVSFRSWW